MLTSSIGHLQLPDHRETGGGAVLVLALVLRDGALHARPIGASALVWFECCTKDKVKC